VSEKRDVDVSGFRPSKQLGFNRRPLSSVTFNEFEEFRKPAGRPVRQNRGHLRAPVYPPFDPFNTTYIPLPGPSSPEYALKLEGGNPHMFEKARFVKFRRPIRQSRKLKKSPVLPKMFQQDSSEAENQVRDPFRYKSSNEFENNSFIKSFFQSLKP